MRTTLSIDDDVLASARHLAERQSRSIGEVISALAREALAPKAVASAVRERNGVPLLPMRGDATPVTLELVNLLRDEQV
ncbi:MAG: hypothetical protein Q8M37_13890 [Nevskia sp.]|nr:hypothetical protein [Nevskia sp.]